MEMNDVANKKKNSDEQLSVMGDALQQEKGHLSEQQTAAHANDSVLNIAAEKKRKRADFLRQCAAEIDGLSNNGSFEVTSIFTGLAKLTAIATSSYNKHLTEKEWKKEDDAKYGMSLNKYIEQIELNRDKYLEYVSRIQDDIKNKTFEYNDALKDNLEVSKMLELLNIEEEKKDITLTYIDAITNSLDAMKLHNDWQLVDMLAKHITEDEIEQKTLATNLKDFWQNTNNSFQELQDQIDKFIPINLELAESAIDMIADLPELGEDEKETQVAKNENKINTYRQQQRQKQ